MVNRKTSHINKRTIKGRFTTSQLYSNRELCKDDHAYGHLDLLGPMQIPGKVCVKCTHIIYKDEVVRRKNELREKVKAIKTHIDLFQF